MRFSTRLHVGIRALLVLLLALPALPARAAGFTVTTLADSGDGSLRQAILDANGTAGADTITFGVSGTITLASTLPAIDDELTIDGSGQSITVSGNNTARVLVVNAGTTLSLNALTIADGMCSPCNGGGIFNNGGTLNVNHSSFSGNSVACSPDCVATGGAIQNASGVLNVSNSTFADNSARSGAGIANFSGSVTITNSTFSSNISSGSGGGIFNFESGNVTVSNSTFSGNSSTQNGGGILSYLGTLEVSNSTFSGNSGYEGGGIMNDHGTLEVSNSTFSGNHADRYGGGGIDSAGDRLTVVNSTFSGNSGRLGGGIFIGSAPDGVSTVTGSTFSGNTAETGGGINNFASTLTVTNSTFSGNSAEQGGGTYHYGGGTMALQNITFAGNSASALGNSIFVKDATTTIENVLLGDSGPGGNCAVENRLIASGSNFSSDYTCPTLHNGIDLRLDADGLKDNGGPTQTIALLPDSPAIDAATGDCPDTDQRGISRPQGSACDIGAFEVEQHTDTTAPTITIGSPADAAVYQLGQSVTASYACADEQGGSGLASCTGTVATGAPIDTATVGSHTFSVQTADTAGNTASKSVTYQVVYPWSGFLQPIDNLPTLNSAKAGSAVPVKFSLGGNYGLNIFASGYPKVQQVACASGAPVDEVEQTVTAGASGLSYDATTGQYSYTWKTDKKWAGSCRQLILKLVDSSEHIAGFQFR